jgi:hypothetical protein
MEKTARMRDDFSAATKELLAKRVGYLCSNRNCGQLTSGPQEDPAKAVNIGVACHITAASSAGPRYDASLTPEQRADISNGIWLCQTCAKLIDNDLTRYTAANLRQWKQSAEQSAARALEFRRSRDKHNEDSFSKVERLMPELLAEMRQDISKFPLCREFVVLKKVWVFCYPESRMFTYYYEDHEELDSKLQILENLGLIRDSRDGSNVACFMMEERFADYLSGG